MDESARDEERQADLRIMAYERFLEAARLDILLDDRGRRAGLETGEDRSLAAEHAPHFRLRLTARQGLRDFVRMDLHAEAPLRVDDLEKEREIRFRRGARAHEATTVLRRQILQRLAGERTVRDGRGGRGMAGNLPGFRAPESGMDVRVECQRIEAVHG